MAEIYLEENVNGGIAEGSKRGYTGAFQDGLGLDYRSDPDKLQVAQQLKKDSGTTVTDLVKWGVEYKGAVYFYGNAGKIYLRASNGSYSNPKTVSNSTGQGIEIFNDELWYANNDGIGKATDLDTTPVYTDDYFVTPQYEAPDFGQLTANNTYTLTTGVNEGATHKLGFTASVDTNIGLTLFIKARGTGNWTVVLHDSSDVALASITVANASVPSSGLTRINFQGVAELTAGNQYHFHVYSSVADGTVRVNTSSDISTAEGSVHQFLDNYDVDQSSNISTASMVSLPNSYTLPTTISEVSTAKRKFTPEVSSLSGIAVLVDSKGSATVTLTVHDTLDRVVGTATLSTGNMKERGTWVQFQFSSALTVIPGVEYHFHLTAPSGTTKVNSSTASDLSTAYYRTYFAILDTDTDYHPMKRFLNKLAVGHGNYLLTVDDAEVLTREAVVFPKGERVRAIETIGDYLAIATWRGTSLADYGRSRIYFWDGFTEGFNAFVDIDGQVNALKTLSNQLFIWHGTQGEISVYTGAITKIRRIKNVKNNISLEIMPGAVDAWEGILYFGLAGVSSNDIDNVIHSYGRKDKDYPFSMNKDFTISTGSKDTGVTIGMVLGISSSKFFVGWKDDSSYGIDVIDTANKQASARIDFLRFDAKDPNRQKEILGVSIRFEALNYTPTDTPTTGEKLEVQYQLNNSGTWISLGTVDPVNNAADRGITYKSFPPPSDDSTGISKETRFFEIEFRILLTSTIASNRTAPVWLSLEMEYERIMEFQLDPS